VGAGAVHIVGTISGFGGLIDERRDN